MDSREDLSGEEVRQPQRIWAPRLELDGAAIQWNSSIREFQKGHSTYVAKTLEHPPAKRHGCFKAHEAARSFHVPKKGSCHGEFTIISFS